MYSDGLQSHGLSCSALLYHISPVDRCSRTYSLFLLGSLPRAKSRKWVAPFASKVLETSPWSPAERTWTFALSRSPLAFQRYLTSHPIGCPCYIVIAVVTIHTISADRKKVIWTRQGTLVAPMCLFVQCVIQGARAAKRGNARKEVGT